MPLDARLRAALLLVCGALVACAGVAGRSEENPFRRGVWPLYTSDARAWAGVQETRTLGPFLHWERQADQRFFEARPLYSSIRAERDWRWDLLYPIAAHRVEPDIRQTWLLLLARRRADLLRETSQTQVGLGFSGRTQSRERYGGVFPFMGHFLERFGFDRIRFILWPLFARGERGGYTETHILWPIFKFGKGDGRRLLRVWPLFGLKTREGVYRKYFFLWPFIFRSHEKLDSRHPRHSLFVLPFYGRRDAGPFASRFYLLPLYMRQWDRRNPEIERLSLLWPIYNRGRESDGREYWSLQPFYSQSRSERARETSVLLGLVGRSELSSDTLEEHMVRVFWVSRWGTRQESGVQTRYANLWPFYRSLRIQGQAGNELGFVRLPYLLPMRGLDPDGWDRHYNKLFEVYGARWRDGERRSSLLFGLREVRRARDVVWESWGGFLHLRRQVAVDLN